MRHDPIETAAQKIPLELIRAAIAGELLIVVGVGLPFWDVLFEAMLQEAIEAPRYAIERQALLDVRNEWQQPRSGGWDWPAKKQFLMQMLGETTVRDGITSRIPTGEPETIHEVLANLHDCAVFVNLAGDGRLEWALNAKRGTETGLVLMRQNQFPDKPGAIVTLHDLGADVSTLWLAGDYELARFWSKLRPRTSAALVVGFGADEDPNAIGAITYGGGGWYWLVESGQLRSIQAERRGLQPIWIRDAAEMVSWLRVFASEVAKTRAAGNSAMRVQAELPRATFDSMAVGVAERFVKQQHRQQGAWTLYREGQLSFEALCAETKLSPFEVVERFFQVMEKEPGPMSPPVEVGRDAPPLLDGLHILTSALELGLLQRFGLLEALVEGIGPTGRVLLFEDVGRPLLEMVAPPEAALEMDKALQLGFAVQKVLRAGMERGRVELMMRPAVEELPALKELPGVSEEKRREIEGRRFWWQRALGYLVALDGHAERRLLSADYFVTAKLGTHPNTALYLEWNAALFQEFVARFDDSTKYLLRIPPLIRALIPTIDSRLEHLTTLARLGFSDAFRREELLELIALHQGFDDGVIDDALDGAQREAEGFTHPGAPVAQIQVADLYSTTIWHAYSSSSELKRADQANALSRLLQRAEELDYAFGADSLEKLLMFLFQKAMDNPLHSMVPDPEDIAIFNVSDESNAGRLWRDLIRWVGPAGKRRTALGCAVRWMILDLDNMPRGNALPVPQWNSLNLIIESMAQGTLTDPILFSISVLGPSWNENPLQYHGFEFKIDDNQAHYTSYETLLSEAAKRLDEQNSVVPMNDALMSYPFAAPSSTELIDFVVPIEPVLLRLSNERLPQWAVRFAHRQGALDGRAYQLLHELANDPSNLNMKGAFAHMTAAAPWRLVREDPTSIRTWRSRAPLGDLFPNRLEDLQVLLSEPVGPLGDYESFMEVLTLRVVEEGYWTARTDMGRLLELSAEIPGVLSCAVVGPRYSVPIETFSKEIERALQHLRQPNDFTTGQICADLYFLRYAAAHRPLVKLPDREVDLRDDLPQILGEVLRATLNPADKSLATIEDALIRLCGQVVGQLAPFGQLEPRLGTWLSHRLFRWLWAQLETLSPDARLAGLEALHKFAPGPQRIPGDDLLHPRRLDRNRHDFRLASVLLAFSSMDELARKHLPPEENGKPAEFRSASSPSIEAELVKLASRSLNEDDYELRSLGKNASCLDWFGPATIPDLALNTLLSLNSEKFFSLAPEVRMVWINDTPRNAEHAVTEELGERIWRTCERYARKLTDDEKTRLEAIARVDESFAPAQAPSHRWSIFAALFLAGQAFLEDEVRTLLENNFADSFAPRAYGLYVAGLSVHAPERIETAAKAILAKVEATSIDPVSFALHLESATYSGKRAGIKYIQRVMLDCAAKEPYKNNERFRIMMSAIGLSGRT